MDFDEYCRSLKDGPEPAGLGPALTALWHAKRKEWDRAHEIVQHEGDRESAWVHAFLHRTEGDIGNAAYWYRTAGQPVASGPLDEEWEEITGQLLSAPDRRRGR